MTEGNPEAYRVIGAALGAFLPLLYIKPLNIRDALARGAFGGICGYIFYFMPIVWFDWKETSREIMAGAAASGSISWIIFGVVVKRVVKAAEEKTRIEEDS